MNQTLEFDEYPHIPAGRRHEYITALKIPNDVALPIPPDSTQISRLIQANLPPKSRGIATTKTSSWFSKDDPTTGLQILLERPIPDHATLVQLANDAQNAWINGCKSVSDPRFNNGCDRLPLYALTFWQEITPHVENQVRWKEAASWVTERCGEQSEIGGTSDPVSQFGVLESLNTLTIGAQVPLRWGAAPVHILASFLGRTWLGVDCMDLMVDGIATRIGQDKEKRGKVWVMPVNFAQAIVQYGSPSGKTAANGEKLLERFEKSLAGADRIYAPFNIRGEHWIALCLDFATSRLIYGDSLSGINYPAPKQELRAFKKWVEERMKRKVTIGGDELKHGNQEDSHSCGLVTANTIEAHIFGGTIWKPSTAVEDRIRRFTEGARLIIRQKESQPIAPQHPKFSLSHLVHPDALGVEGGSTAGRSAATGQQSEGPSTHQGDVPVVRLGPDGNDNSRPEDDTDHVSVDDRDNAMDVDAPEPSLGQKRPRSPSNEPSHPTPKKAATVPACREAVVPECVAGLGKGVAEAKVATKAKKAGNSILAWAKKVVKSETGTSRGGSGSSASINVVAKSVEPVKNAPKSSETKGAGKASVAQASSSKTGGVSDTKSKSKTSSKYDKAKRGAYKEGTYKMTPAETAEWRAKILEINPAVLFDDDDQYRYFHPACNQWLHTKGPKDVTRFRQHDKACRPPSMTLSKFCKPNTSGSQTQRPAVRQVPCPGLLGSDDEEVSSYLGRTGASGGGGKDFRAIAEDVFKSPFSKLKGGQKAEVLDRKRLTNKWQNDHQNLRVFATSCHMTVVVQGDASPLPCFECREVRKSQAFKKAISKPTPEKENKKYTNKKYINEVLGKHYAGSKGLQDLVEDENAMQSTPVKFALGCLEGKYNEETLRGLVDSYVTMEDRKEKGKGLQNFKYTPEFLRFCHDQHTTNPAAYRGLQQVFHLPEERTLEKHLAKEPRFPFSISEKNFDLVKEHLDAIAYDGPVGLGCDDTKLFSGLQLTWDAEKKAHYLIGGCEEPIQVLNAESVQQEMDRKENRAGTKLRLWVLTVPYPKIPSIIVAAKAIPDDLKGQDLAAMSLRIMRGLIGRGIKLISYCCDGSEVERSAEKIVISKADSTHTFEIPSSCEGTSTITVSIPVFDGQPVAIGQDSKHALKTFRNNLYSGARLLTLGNFVAMYARIREVAEEENSPLYWRDVDKVDRQDDSAATRLFSADVLSHITTNHPEYLGESAYLFIFGELIDAFQNRFITHHERLKMVLRARHFLNHWEMFLKVSGYPKASHTISKEALDISRILIDGYLSLLYIHRDCLHGKYPFCPWLHSTEPCEHCFGEARKIVKDFNFRDFIYMIPKLLNRLRHSMRHHKIDPKACAVGYVHTYMDANKVNMVNLATFPTPSEVVKIDGEALAETESVLHLLGIMASRLRAMHRGLPAAVLPSISSFHVRDRRDHTASSSSTPRDAPEDSDDNDSIRSVYDNEISPQDREQLDGMLADDTAGYLLDKAENEVQALRCAAFALEADEFMELQSANKLVTSPLSEQEEDALADDMIELQECERQVHKVKDLVLSEPTMPLGLGNGTLDDLDLSALVNIRRAHQTEQAAKSSRTRSTLKATDPENDIPSNGVVPPVGPEDKEASIARKIAQTRKEIAQKFLDIVRARKNQAPGTGKARNDRWTGGDDGNAVKTTATGNAANAAAVAASSAAGTATKRRNAFQRQNVPHLDFAATARISSMRPLRSGDFVFFVAGVSTTTVFVGKVITMYSRTAGSNARNAVVYETANISALSRVAVQVFEHAFQLEFTSRPSSTSLLSTHQFLLLPPIQVLFLLQEPTTGARGNIHLSSKDFDCWKTLETKLPKFQAAIKDFKKRVPAGEEAP